MANPQKENGNTQIANELLEQLVQRGLLGTEYQIVFFVIRKTYGWHKKEDVISFSQFKLGTNLSRTTINKTLKNLVLKKILVKRSIPARQQIAYKFNKNWDEWLVHPNGLVQQKMTTSTLVRLKPVQRGVHTKETTKENKKDLILRKQKTENIKNQLRQRWGKKGQLNERSN
jgi:phage replication O-like protein O